MRTVPESIKLALNDASLPIKKRILLYRRVWNADTERYELQSAAVDITHLLVEAGSIKLALDTDEVDKWDASNVTLTFNNDLNCFKEGLAGGLFENAVLWGSKLVYLIEPGGKDAVREQIAVFTGYVYSSPVLRDNGNRIELTVTSSLDALEYVSAEEFCLSKTDEAAAAVTSANEKDQGKEFATLETGVGYIDCVKYGADLANAQVLRPGDDYTVDKTNLYAYSAVIKLRNTPTEGYRIWLSYRYWHKDMKIEDIVSALLDLARVEKRNVEKAVFNGASALEYDTSEPAQLLVRKDEYGAYTTLQGMFYGQSSNYNSRLILTEKVGASAWGALHTEYPCYLPVKNSYIHVGALTGIYTYRSAYQEDWASMDFLTDSGTGVRFKYSGYGRGGTTIACYPILEYGYLEKDVVLGPELFSAGYSCFVGFDFDENGKMSLYTSASHAGFNNSVSQSLGEVIKTPTNFVFNGIFTKFFQNLVIHKGPLVNTPNCFFSNQFAWRSHCVDEFVAGQNLGTFYKMVFGNKNYGRIYNNPGLVYELALGENGKKWNKLEYHATSLNTGKGQWTYQDSAGGAYSEEIMLGNNENIPSSLDYVRITYKITSPAGSEKLENIKISKVISTAGIPLANMTDLDVKSAIEQLAQMVSYEIGFNQEGTFFFRSRQGSRTEAELTPAQIIETDSFSADIESLRNRVAVSFGMFQTVVDDFTEDKPRPNSVDTYGVHELSVAQGNFIPADNVDISGAVAKANYEALSTPGYSLQADCRPDLSLELGDKITVCAENTQIADKTWSDYNKYLKLPVWKRVFKVVGIELSFAKRLMTLNLKDVTSAEDVPNMQYNEYQTRFPTPLDYKE